MKGIDEACNRCEISMNIMDNDIDRFVVTETWLSARGDIAKIIELAPCGLDVRLFPRRSQSSGGGIAEACKCSFGSNITL